MTTGMALFLIFTSWVWGPLVFFGACLGVGTVFAALYLVVMLPVAVFRGVFRC